MIRLPRVPITCAVCSKRFDVNSFAAKTRRYCSVDCYNAVRSNRYRHGHARDSGVTPEYTAWVHMRARCCKPDHPEYKNYGGRGITICDRWLNSFEAFLEDMGSRPSPKHSIDRIDNANGHYEPSNCRWTTQTEQGRNTRANHLVTWNGATRCIAEWSEITGIKASTLFRRVTSGWSPEQVLTAPVGQWVRSTHCKRGHIFTEASTRTNPKNGQRQCRICSNDLVRAKRAGHKLTTPRVKLIGAMSA